MGVLIVAVDVVEDGFDQRRDVMKGAPANPLMSQIGEPSFNQIQPGTGRGSEMHLESRMSFQPRSHSRVFVSTVVVHDDVEIQARGGFLIDSL